jgi:hypothetical protein
MSLSILKKTKIWLSLLDFSEWRDKSIVAFVTLGLGDVTSWLRKIIGELSCKICVWRDCLIPIFLSDNRWWIVSSSRWAYMTKVNPFSFFVNFVGKLQEGEKTTPRTWEVAAGKVRRVLEPTLWPSRVSHKELKLWSHADECSVQSSWALPTRGHGQVGRRTSLATHPGAHPPDERRSGRLTICCVFFANVRNLNQSWQPITQIILHVSEGILQQTKVYVYFF